MIFWAISTPRKDCQVVDSSPLHKKDANLPATGRSVGLIDVDPERDT
jgi:hypothetical protein